MHGNHLEKATVCFDVTPQLYSPLTCGVNYYDLIMNGTAVKCGRIEITYGEKITISGLIGDFSMFLFTLSDNCPMQFGCDMITISGVADSKSTVSLSWDGKTFILDADQQLTAVTVKAEPSDRKTNQIAECGDTAKNYRIKIVEGIPNIEGVYS